MKPKKKERSPELSESDLLAHLSRLPRPASIREIASALALRHHGRRALPKLLSQLVRRGEVEKDHDRYRLIGRRGEPSETRASGPMRSETVRAGIPHARQDANLISGRLVAHRDGYGFVVPETPIPGMDGDLFISPAGIGDAMHGDRVIARVTRRHPGRRFEGRIEKITGRAHPTVVGLFRYGPRENTVLPYDIRIAHEIVIPPGSEITSEISHKLSLESGESPRASRLRLPELDGAVVNVELTRYPKGGVAPAGRVVEIIGRPGEMGVDVEIIIRKHYLPHSFSDAVLAQASATPQSVGAEDIAGRRDFRELPIVTIDGETARDFDDAVYVAARPGGYELQVHIADVAHYVRRGSELDREARLRGTSVYFPNRAVPMLPEALSNGICSLNPRVDRLVMSAIMQIDASGKVTSAEFMPGVIRSAERMTYTNVNKILEGDPEITRRYSQLVGEFHRMKELALHLNARRSARGSIDFDLPEPVIEFDDMGRMVAIVRSERNIANRIIEEFMLTANEAVAAYLERRGIPSLHRVHEKPDPKKVLEFEELAHAFGYSLGVEDLAARRVAVRHGQIRPAGRERHGRERPMEIVLPAGDIDIRPQHYQRLTEKIAGKPEERIVSYLMLRSLKQARYAAEPLGHFALGFDEYTHFTSPIRRYPDLVVHRVLKWALEHPEAATPKPSHEARGAEATLYSQRQLEEMASETSEAERRANGAERELMDWKTAQFMEQHLGEEYEALIISVQKFGCFVELFEVFVEGLLPINALEDAAGSRVVFRERDHAMVALPGGDGRRGVGARRGRGAKPKELAWRLGDRVRVRAERIDPMRRRVEFAIAGADESQR